MIQDSPAVSIIIPTYNRKNQLRETLQSLARQTYPFDRFEVIIVDDGSTDGTHEITAEVFPFPLRYVHQSNQGDAAARNFGVQQSQADMLVFLDDDILVETDYLTHLLQAHGMSQNRIVVGTANLWLAETTPFSQSLSISPSVEDNNADGITKLQFRDVFSNNMAIRRDAYFKIGMMQGLDFPGSSMWCDLDFNYRAYQQGFEFYRSNGAVCWHRDYTVRSFDTYKKRMRTAAYRAVVLFHRYPELMAHVPMFYDKTPINWRQDVPRLVLRKLSRALTSSQPVLWGMEQIVNFLEKHFRTSSLLPKLYSPIVGGYIFQGYRQGLSDFGHIGPGENVPSSSI